MFKQKFVYSNNVFMKHLKRIDIFFINGIIDMFTFIFYFNTVCWNGLTHLVNQMK